MKEMAKEWTDDLTVGVAKIDDQHREFIAALNALLEAMSKGKGREEISGLLQFVEGYVDRHFKLEEEYMRRFMYPEYRAHKAIHDGFIMALAEIQKEFGEKGEAIKLVIKVEKQMLDWLFNHIKETDKKLGVFLKGKV
jgi:hemerythrin